MGSDLTQLLVKVRQGDQEASRQLVRQYESAIRVAVRTNLSDPRLRRQFDSLDVCQSVLASFFFHMTAGAYDLQSQAQLLALLTKMAQNKLGSRARNQFRQRRDVRRLSQIPAEDANVASHDAGPTDVVDDHDLLNRALGMMTPEIRDIAVRRMKGELWPNIASAMGGTPDARRKQFERAMQPIAESLNSHLRDL
jgi:DNA-directed RNA polymerase specialized sigma24 family protein